MGKPNCSGLTYKAKGQLGLKKIPEYSDLWRFAESWIYRFNSMGEHNHSERFIFLWVTVNAWASMAVSDISKNHVDQYLIHSIGADRKWQERFNKKLDNDPRFRENVENLLALAPVFQVLWLRNMKIPGWNQYDEPRLEYIQRVAMKDPYHYVDDKRFAAFAPLCAIDHMNNGESIPVDWPHTIQVIYQIRCNLFHGGKDYFNPSDRKFVELAWSVLWDMWSPELPRWMKPEHDIGRDITNS